MAMVKYNYVGIPIGVVLGIALGLATDNLGAGAAVGLCIGIALGYFLPGRKKDKNEEFHEYRKGGGHPR